MEIEREHLLITRTKTSGDNLEEEFQIAALHRRSLTRIFLKHLVTWAQHSVDRLPIRVTLSNLGALAVLLAIVLPKTLTYMLLYPIFRLVFGTLYPAYASYKAVRTQNVKEYVKWMMYWIVFALFTCAETFTDVFFSFWFPFYYEIKIILVLWLLSPATKGSSILYRRFVHPALTRREAEIDEALARATEQGYKAVLHLGTRGVNYATTVLMQTAIKNFPSIIPSPSNEILTSQSDPAIFSSASHKASPQSTRLSRDRKDDAVDGGGPMNEAEKSKVPNRASKKVDRPVKRILGNGDYDDNTNEEMSLEEEEEKAEIEKECEEMYEDVRLAMNIDQREFLFKEPKKKATRKKRAKRKTVITPEKNSTMIIDEPEYSDNNDVW